MNIAVFGLGYVGCVTAAGMARNGHYVTGIDNQSSKVESILLGESPIVEPGLPELIALGVRQGNLTATTSVGEGIRDAEIAIICVGTPSLPNGDLNLAYVKRVCEDIGKAIRYQDKYLVIAVRSTLLPNLAEEQLLPHIASVSHHEPGQDFGFVVNPEFLREGSALTDFDNPPFTVIGQLDERSGDKVAELYATLSAPLYRVSLGEAEMVKYASNAFHALKIAFANEIGNICNEFNLDSHKVMDIFTQDLKLNISPAYLRPGFAFGGSCLGKDLRALLYSARQTTLELPVLEAILPSNRRQIDKISDYLIQKDSRRITIIGLSFKPRTDDLRESPAVELAERLIGKGFDVHIYDREVSLSRLHGSNRAFMDQTIPHLASLLEEDLAKAISAADTVVITKSLSDEEVCILNNSLTAGQSVVDLVRVKGLDLSEFAGSYYGISW